MPLPETTFKVVPGGVRLRLHLVPGAKRNAIAGLHGEAVKVAVKAPPVDGKANLALRKYLAELCGVSLSATAIISGELSRDKVVAIKSGDGERILSIIMQQLSLD